MSGRYLESGHYYRVPNRYTDEYQRHLGPCCTSVLTSICRHADREGKASLKNITIKNETGLSPRQIKRETKKLHEYNIATKTHKGRNNEYQLQPQEEYKPLLQMCKKCG